MAFQSIIAFSLVVSAALAQTCGPTNGDQVYAAEMGIYSDKDCLNRMPNPNEVRCFYTYKDVAEAGPGVWGCGNGVLPSVPTPFWVRIEDSPFDQIQLIFTRDSTCPPQGPGAVFATLIDNRSCVQMGLGGEFPGVTIYPQGGAPISRRLIEKRDGTCSGFVVESSVPSQSGAVQVSPVVDCTNGGADGCNIQLTEENSKSVSTSYEVSAGGGIEGVFNIEATFGQEFTDTTTTGIGQTFTVPQGQKGYVAAYSAATLFTGRFTGCDTGDAEQPGRALVMKKNGFTYTVVLTGSRKAPEEIRGGSRK